MSRQPPLLLRIDAFRHYPDLELLLLIDEIEGEDDGFLLRQGGRREQQ